MLLAEARTVLLANAVQSAEKKRAVLLSCIGAKVYGVLRNVVSPEKPSEKSFDELTEALREHYSPKPLLIAERFKFHKRDQRVGERVTDYIIALKQLSNRCEFGDFLKSALRDRLVCGIIDTKAQRYLLTKKNLTFETACEYAIASESAERDSKQFQDGGEPSLVKVNKVSAARGQSNSQSNGRGTSDKKKGTASSGKDKPGSSFSCWRCGSSSHTPESCGFKKAKCFKCKKVGHTKLMCRSGKRQQVHEVHEVEESELESEDDLGMYTLYTVSRSGQSYSSISEELVIEGVPLKMEIDTGASMSVVPSSFYKENLTHIPLKVSTLKLKDYGGNLIKVLGEVQVQVCYNQQSYTLPLIVIEDQGDRPALLGRNWLGAIKLNWKRLFKVHAVSVEETVGQGTCKFSETGQFPESILKEFPEVFSARDGVSAPPIEGFKATLKLKDNAKPIFCKARPVPFAMKEEIDKELDTLEAGGKIYKVDHSEWTSPTVNIPKSNGRVRICGDYKVSVNRMLDVDQYPLPSLEDCFAQLHQAAKSSPNWIWLKRIHS